jgi:chromosomal replication initiator protein
LELILEKTTVWDDVLGLVRERLNQQIFETWFLPINFIGLDEERHQLQLSAGDATKDWVDRYYSEMLEGTLSELNLTGYTVAWSQHAAEPVEDTNTNETAEDELYFEPKARPVIHGVTTNFRELDPIDTSLNPKYTFDKFVVGSGNQFAHAAALGAAESPGTTYNPLFIYGGVGLGKTHLMHAIGHSIRYRNPSLRVAYITSEKFMNELINAIRFDKTPAFRDKYRSIDVLLMDDVQFMAGKERTQEEFFHTFNTLHNNQKQIVISSDCPPREIPTLEERLHSRFEWGLIADIEPPDLETKVAILKRKVRLVAIASLKGLPLSKMLAQEAMKNIIDSEHPAGLTMDRIARTVASQYKMTVEELKSKSNSRAIAVPRQVAMYLCKKLTRHSFPEIGREFGGKHHTTVMHSVDKIETLTRDDRVFHKSVSELIDSLCS